MKKIIRVATHSGSLGKLLQGQLRFMGAYYQVLGIGSAGEMNNGKSAIDTLATTEGIRVIPVEMTRSITPIKDLKAVYQLYKIFKKEKPFIVHSHTPKAGTLAMIAARIARVPHRLHTVAGLPLVEATGIKRRLLNFIEKITYSCATKVYPNSLGLQKIIVDNGFSKPSKLKIIGKGSSNGIDTERFSPSLYPETEKERLRSELSISTSSFVYIYLGRIVKDKGINELIAAFTQMEKEHPQITLLLVGYYDEGTAGLLPETSLAMQTHRSIKLVEWQEDVRPFLALANVLAFPSYREGFPNTVLQASAMQVPSVVTDINGCNEIIQEGINGVIVPVKNAESLREGMERLLLDTQYYEQLIKSARKPICTNYERSYIWESLLEEYRSLEQVK